MRLIDADALWMEIIHRMDYCDDILEIIEEMPTIEPELHWTPIDEKLPITGKEVLVTDNNNDVWICSLYKPDVRVPFRWEDKYGHLHDFDCFSAWMPLPKPYKENQDEDR